MKWKHALLTVSIYTDVCQLFDTNERAFDVLDISPMWAPGL